MSEKKKSVLGRGLGALLEANDTLTVTREKNNASATLHAAAVIQIPLEQIEVNPFQPRTTFEEESLQELADSIRVHGVIQPITVRKTDNNKYQLIAGERRLRASKIAGKKDIPAYVRSATDQESIEIALIENIQREDLNPLEIAINYKRLQDECDLTQEQLAERLGKNRSTVTNFLRLLKLPPDVQAGLRDGKITMGHAKALMAIENPVSLLAAYKEVVQKNLNVRQVETLVRSYTDKPRKSNAARQPLVNQTPPAVLKMQDRIMQALSTKVIINRTRDGKGEIIIRFYSDDDLTRLTELIAET
ncbi:MAG: ParB/RepB/Spo0J family partition protein [Chitinophagales bacterium]|nr:ParB/RepB/Spo0J family partition protein [Chitinophagales bacterium]MDW8419069.1 ParB/RepB/Spo0J family partition protein [Chitinophagales bacterium]